MAKEIDPRAKALGRQLGAQIKRSEWKSARKFADALVAAGHPTDYTTLTRRIAGTATMPTADLLVMLDLLDIRFDTFVERAMELVTPQQ